MPVQLNYNSIGLDINRVRVARKSMMDGPNYLFTRHVIHCTGVYNPAATAYLPQQQIDKNQKVLAPDTDVSIRNALMTPRRPLNYKVGNSEVIVSPWAQDPKQTLDDNNGPTPIACDVTKVHGQKTFEVEFVVQTDINEDRLMVRGKDGLGVQNFILSNVYSQEDDIDDHFFLTRVTRGKAVFSTGLLQALDNGFFQLNGQNVRGDPDIFRKMIMQQLPVPDFCKRENFRFSVDEFNNSLTYSFTDRELAFNIVAQNFPNIVEIRCTQTRNAITPDTMSVFFSKALFGLMASYVGSMIGKNAADFSILGFNFSGIGATAGVAGGAAAGWNIAKFLPSNMWRMQDEWSIDIFGNSLCTKQMMLDCANTILESQLKRTKAESPITGFIGKTQTSTSFDLAGKHLHVSLSIELGYLNTVFNMFADNIGVRLPKVTTFGEGVSGVLQSAPTPNPVPPGDGVSRGVITPPIIVKRPA